MNNLSYAVSIIKDSVTALDVANVAGLEVKHGRCRCPIHNGGDMNCRLYPGNRGFHCFSCGASGDVISLVQQYYRMQFPDVIRWFNATFNLGMDIDSPLSKEAVKQAENARKKRERDREFREWKEKMQFDMALTAENLVRRLEEQRDLYRPRRYGEEWDDRFCTAVLFLPEARKFADDCMMDCMKEVQH